MGSSKVKTEYSVMRWQHPPPLFQGCSTKPVLIQGAGTAQACFQYPLRAFVTAQCARYGQVIAAGDSADKVQYNDKAMDLSFPHYGLYYQLFSTLKEFQDASCNYAFAKYWMFRPGRVQYTYKRASVGIANKDASPYCLHVFTDTNMMHNTVSASLLTPHKKYYLKPGRKVTISYYPKAASTPVDLYYAQRYQATRDDPVPGIPEVSAVGNAASGSARRYTMQSKVRQYPWMDTAFVSQQFLNQNNEDPNQQAISQFTFSGPTVFISSSYVAQELVQINNFAVDQGTRLVEPFSGANTKPLFFMQCPYQSQQAEIIDFADLTVVKRATLQFKGTKKHDILSGATAQFCWPPIFNEALKEAPRTSASLIARVEGTELGTLPGQDRLFTGQYLQHFTNAPLDHDDNPYSTFGDAQQFIKSTYAWPQGMPTDATYLLNAPNQANDFITRVPQTTTTSGFRRQILTLNPENDDDDTAIIYDRTNALNVNYPMGNPNKLIPQAS